jgi:hypothetical protein
VWCFVVEVKKLAPNSHSWYPLWWQCLLFNSVSDCEVWEQTSFQWSIGETASLLILASSNWIGNIPQWGDEWYSNLCGSCIPWVPSSSHVRIDIYMKVYHKFLADCCIYVYIHCQEWWSLISEGALWQLFECDGLMLFRVMKLAWHIWVCALFLWVKHHVAELPGLKPYSIHITKSHRFPVPRDAEKHSSVTILVNFTNTVKCSFANICYASLKCQLLRMRGLLYLLIDETTLLLLMIWLSRCNYLSNSSQVLRHKNPPFWEVYSRIQGALQIH